jgi:Lon protease-like protein
MTNFIPIFPLAIVLYPGEELNLHIFEPRYKQLIKYCADNKKPFGIPSVINNQINEIGTLAEVVEISKIYDNGEMDIKTKGSSVFRILEIVKEVPDKLYSGAIVNYLHNYANGNKKLMQKVIEDVRQLHKILKVNKQFKKSDDELLSYEIAHHIGLSLEEEYELVGLMEEIQRQEYLKRHLTKILLVMAQMETLKQKINQNGHFKNLDAFDL